MKYDLPDDETLRRYLLGELPEGEEDEVERLLLDRDELYERCEAVEADLLDELESGSLNAAQQQRIERWLDHSTDLQLRHQIVRGLRDLPAPEISSDREPASEGVVIPLPPRRPTPTWVPWLSLAAALLLGAGVYWLTGRDQVKPEPRQAHETPAPSPVRVPDVQKPGPTPVQPPPQVAQKPPTRPKGGSTEKNNLKSLGHAVPIIAATVLEISLEVRRDGAGDLQQIALGNDAKQRTLHFLFDFPPQTDRFSLKLLDAHGAEVGSWNEVKVRTVKEDRALIVTLPAAKLPPGRYGVEAQPIAPGPDDVPVQVQFEIVSGKS